MKTIVRALSVASLVLVSTAGVTASADVIVGTPTPGTGNCIPIGCTFSGVFEYQQVYASTAFSGPINIGSISFFHTVIGAGSGQYAAGSYNFFLGTTTKPVNGLDPVFANNVTSGLTLFGSFLIAPGTSAAASTFTFVGGPFFYDPLAGNLLLDLQYNNTGATNAAVFLDNDASGSGATSRAVGGTTSNTGLVTGFGTASTVTPEPASIALTATGLIVLGGVARRRRQHRMMNEDDR